MIARPTFRPHLRVEIVPGEGLVLLSETQQVLLVGPLYALIASRLDGRTSTDAIVTALSAQADAAQVRQVLAELEHRGLLTEGCSSSAASEAAFWATHAVDPAAAVERLTTGSVSVDAVGDIAVAPFIQALQSAGVRVTARAARQVVLADDYLHPELRSFNGDALAADREWLLIKPTGCVVWLGPVFRPGRTACWECLAQRLAANRTVENFLSRRDREARAQRPPRVSTAATEELAARIAARAVAAWLACDEAPGLDGAMVTLDLRSWRSDTHRVIARPQCRACGCPPDRLAEVARPLVLESRLKTFTQDGGHRTRTPELTVELFQHHVSPISGAVPVLQRSGMPRDGVTHAYVAGLNLSRPPRTLAMLQDGLRMRTGGKGASDAQAHASALCEALERYSGVFQGDEPRRQARAAELGDAAIHPNACMGFSAAQYREREAWNAHADIIHAVPLPFDEDAVVSWTPAWSLTRSETRYLPTGFCFYDYPVFPEAAYCIACSNGNAAGNTVEEAIVQGVLELVERDSVALWWYSRAQRPGIALDSFDDPYVHRLTAHLAQRGRDLVVLDLRSDLGIPVFAAVSRRRDRHPEQIVLGFGAHLDARIALLRAVTELNQMLLRVLWCEPPAGAGATSVAEPLVRQWLDQARLAEHPHLAPHPTQPQQRSADFARCWSDDVREDVRYCQRLVEQRGMEVLVLDQTRPDIGLPVVKVIVPGLRHFWPRFAPGRLYDVPVELGWIPAPLRETQLNPTAMFL